MASNRVKMISYTLLIKSLGPLSLQKGDISNRVRYKNRVEYRPRRCRTSFFELQIKNNRFIGSCTKFVMTSNIFLVPENVPKRTTCSVLARIRF